MYKCSAEAHKRVRSKRLFPATSTEYLTECSHCCCCCDCCSDTRTPANTCENICVSAIFAAPHRCDIPATATTGHFVNMCTRNANECGRARARISRIPLRPQCCRLWRAICIGTQTRPRPRRPPLLLLCCLCAQFVYALLCMYMQFFAPVRPESRLCSIMWLLGFC